MDDMVEYFSNLVDVLAPWNEDGTPREDRDHDLWFRAVAAFQGFLALRAPFQSPRLSAVAIASPPTQQRTMVNVTILNDRGEKVYSDADAAYGDPGDGAKVIEHEDWEAA
jgi:hypothetical protein